ncbi:class I SAM-dependent methyltransferase [Bifidobacterium bombi]|uniref:class I SAM-dependent methyltransferase n=1 Tax=Bifidobacterium bombi TaxID=471511 RepID=UPI0019308E64|nr:class I SAM-dependent methyltransferase [Bifidobacterium bombi]
MVIRDLEVLGPHVPDGSVQGLSLLHLQCHIGTDTISWARLGAKDVYGLDFSANALRHANDLTERAGERVTYVQADARKAAEALQGKRFDVIVTSVGTVTWLPDLADWAYSIAALLNPGGVFMIRDSHPLLFALDESLHISMDYCSGAEDSWQSDETYTLIADDSVSSRHSSSKITHMRNHNWAHDFAEMTGVLLDAGLEIRELGEHEESDWKSLPMLEYDERRRSWHMPQGLPRIPLTFSIVAGKPDC